MRSGAQLISFEISLALIMLLIVMLTGTASLREIVLSQQGTILDWWIFKLPFLGFIAFVIYMISSTAELNRAPFDISEAESELTGGFATEYSGSSFAMFFFAEFVNMFVSAGLATTFFLGGFLAPKIGIGFVDVVVDFIPGFVWFFLKTFLVIFLYMWFRWSFPRLRVDQLMYLEWKMLLPANLLLLMTGGFFLAMGVDAVMKTMQTGNMTSIYLACRNYLHKVGTGFISLLQGMGVTIRYFVSPEKIITQQYPENRETL